MRALAKFLAVVTVLAVLTAGYAVWASDARVEAKGYVVESAADRSSSFEGIVQALRMGEEGVEACTQESIGTPENYVFVTYTLQLSNRDIVPVEWLEVSAAYHEGDVLFVKPEVQTVPPLNQSTFSFTMMMDRSVQNYAREVKLSYYIYGHYKEVRLMAS